MGINLGLNRVYLLHDLLHLVVCIEILILLETLTTLLLPSLVSYVRVLSYLASPRISVVSDNDISNILFAASAIHLMYLNRLGYMMIKLKFFFILQDMPTVSSVLGSPISLSSSKVHH